MVEPFAIKNLRAESTRLSQRARELNNGRPIAAAVNLANFVQAEIDEKG
jgi:hypothetical protein